MQIKTRDCSIHYFPLSQTHLNATSVQIAVIYLYLHIPKRKKRFDHSSIRISTADHLELGHEFYYKFGSVGRYINFLSSLRSPLLRIAINCGTKINVFRYYQGLILCWLVIIIEIKPSFGIFKTSECLTFIVGDMHLKILQRCKCKNLACTRKLIFPVYYSGLSIVTLFIKYFF